MRIPFLILVLSVGVLMITGTASAQIIPNFGAALTLIATPEHPSPGTTVSIALSSFSTDLDRSGIRWYIDGTAVPSADGSKTFSVQSGTLGSEKRITAIVIRDDGSEAAGEILLRPTTLDLLWEADSYVPPLYRGRVEASPGSTVRVEAAGGLVHEDGSPLSPHEIVYTWRVNGALKPAASGRGKYRAAFPAPPLFGADTITVEAASVDGLLVAGASARIASTEPKLVLYQDHPLFGTLSHQAITEVSRLTGPETTFAAIPYFLPVSSLYDRNLSWKWRVNDSPVSTDVNDPNRLTVRGDSKTHAAISLALTHTLNWFLDARGSWSATLGQGSEGASNPFTSERAQ